MQGYKKEPLVSSSHTVYTQWS